MNSVSKILSGGFAGLGDVLREKAGPALKAFQNSLTPAPRPVNGSGNTFNFAGAVQKLFQPFQRVTDPANAAKTDVINSIGSGVAGIIGAASNKAIDIIQNGNDRPKSVTTAGLNVSNPVPSQNTPGLSVGDLLAYLNSSKPAQASTTTTDSLAKAAGQNAFYNVALIGGGALILILLLQKGR